MKRVPLSMACLLLLICGCRKQPGQETTVRVDGSSTVFPIMEAFAEEFQKANPSCRVIVGVSGTGGGFKKFAAAETDITGASRPIRPIETEACAARVVEYVELPLAYDGLAVVIHPTNDWASHITVAELKRLWEPAAQGQIKRWNQVRSEWPDQEIHLYGAGVDSGTYDYFTAAIVGTEHSSRGDFTSSEDDNVLVQGIAGDPLALGFFGLAYFEENQNKLKLVPVDDGVATNGDGPVAPSVQTVMDGTYQPLSRPIFMYVSKSALQRSEVEEFVRFGLAHAAPLVEEVGYIPLPGRAYSLAQDRVDQRITGSLFGGKGSQVGVKIEELLEREQGDK